MIEELMALLLFLLIVDRFRIRECEAGCIEVKPGKSERPPTPQPRSIKESKEYKACKTREMKEF